NMHRIVIPLVGLLLTATLHARVWTLTDQRTFEADYVTATATHVSLKVSDGRVFPLEIARLSQADRDFIAQQLSKPAVSQPATPPPGIPKPNTPTISPSLIKPATFKGPYA